ncbi:hypothetical protein L228DRAFT_268028 [Xylona heveae TC161]|uniref:Uncharacterized protein n=1 Tax=Xylona heveae (strain CBS 132557 / TC161) TaxID=1328760 RepID=A0A165GVB3_XYLHT|nr:hypothetical protein L228DRAFT_268028 [Xylona heveae TC161]KZF22639.1 hypothetical protein L228DRAFT_268028 [Xylona heveae TC161]
MAAGSSTTFDLVLEGACGIVDSAPLPLALAATWRRQPLSAQRRAPPAYPRALATCATSTFLPFVFPRSERPPPRNTLEYPAVTEEEIRAAASSSSQPHPVDPRSFNLELRLTLHTAPPPGRRRCNPALRLRQAIHGRFRLSIVPVSLINASCAATIGEDKWNCTSKKGRMIVIVQAF